MKNRQNRLLFTVQIIAILFCLDVWSTNAALQANTDRVALVIGNSDYLTSPLLNPVNDAVDIAAVLQKCQFSVTVVMNADRRKMRLVIRQFGDKIRNSDVVGLFYYAGHGIQVNGENYLVPVNADVKREDEIADECIRVSSVLRKMDTAGNRLNIVILDACRDNPFVRSFRSNRSGLAKMDAPTGTILAYATAPGSTAADGTGRNGLYTANILRHILAAGQSIESFFKNVRIDVVKSSNGRQVPWESSSLMDDFAFIEGEKVKTQAEEPGKESPPPSRVTSTPEKKVTAAFIPEQSPLKKLNPFKRAQLPGKKIINKWGMEFILIPAGTFKMGSGSIPGEAPEHMVSISKPFFIQTTEVTRSQWKKITGSAIDKKGFFDRFVKHKSEEKVLGDYFQDIFTNQEELPAVNISWQDSQALIEKLNREDADSGTYRHPTEAEWEYACTQYALYGMAGLAITSNLSQIAWFSGNSDGKLHPVKTKKPVSEAGLFGMLGNTAEWCSDLFGAYSSDSSQDPEGPTRGNYRVHRGGSFKSDAGFCRPTARGYALPNTVDDGIGLRLVITP